VLIGESVPLDGTPELVNVINNLWLSQVRICSPTIFSRSCQKGEFLYVAKLGENPDAKRLHRPFPGGW